MKRKSKIIGNIFLAIGIIVVVVILITSVVIDTETMSVHEIATFSLYSSYAKLLGFLCFALAAIIKYRNGER